jgi:hypothetical protein
MTLALDNYASVQSNLFVKIECPYYKSSAGATPTGYEFLFSDRVGTYFVEGGGYVGLGKLLSITSSASELRSSSSDLTITVSGIPNSSLAELIHSRIKGSKVTIRRVVFNSNTGVILPITGNPMTRFIGFVNNMALDEEYDTENRISSNTVVLSCSSVVDVMQNKISGRRTNPASMKRFYSSDISMDRVPTLINSYFDFGAKK